MPATTVCLICLVGLPSSGKSTLARDLQMRFEQKYSVNVVSFDEMISMDGDKTWKNKRIDVLFSVEHLIHKYLNYSDKQVLVILDDNMFYRSMRYEYYQLARKYKLGFCEIYLLTPLAVCLESNRLRTNPVPDNTIIKMNSLLEIPDCSSNKWEEHLIFNRNLSETDWLNFEKMVQHCFLNPVTSVGKTHKNAIPQSALHLAEIALRKIVNELIKKKKDTVKDLRLESLELVKKRQQVLNSVRIGEIILPENSSDENCVLVYTEYLQQYFS